jgi:hypothetical protein
MPDFLYEVWFWMLIVAVNAILLYEMKERDKIYKFLLILTLIFNSSMLGTQVALDSLEKKVAERIELIDSEDNM